MKFTLPLLTLVLAITTSAAPISTLDEANIAVRDKQGFYYRDAAPEKQGFQYRDAKPEPEKQGFYYREAEPEPEKQGFQYREAGPEPEKQGFQYREAGPEPEKQGFQYREAKPEPEKQVRQSSSVLDQSLMYFRDSLTAKLHRKSKVFNIVMLSQRNK